MGREADPVADPVPVEALFDEHWVTAWRAAYAVTGRTDLADDAAQDAFIAAIRSLSKYDPGRPFAPWIAKIAVNRARDLLRAERRRRVTELDEDFEAAAQADASGLLPAVAALPGPQREAVVLHHVLGFTLKRDRGDRRHARRDRRVPPRARRGRDPTDDGGRTCLMQT